MPITSKPAKSVASGSSRSADLIAVRDILLLLATPVLGFVAWLVSERYWSRVAGFIAHLVSPLLLAVRPGVFDRIRLTTNVNKDKLSPKATYVHLFAGRIEQELQYLRDYRPGGWNPGFIVTGREHLDRVIDAGSGGILWVAPMLFSSLAVKKGLHEAGFELSHLSREYHGPSDTRFGRKFINPITINCENHYLAQRLSMRAGHESSALRKLVRALCDKQLVSITCSYYGRKIVNAPLLGGTLPIAVGAAHLAVTTGAPLLPVFTVRRSWREYEIIVQVPMQLPAKGSQDDVISEIVCNYASLVEQYVNCYPGTFTDWRYLDFS